MFILKALESFGYVAAIEEPIGLACSSYSPEYHTQVIYTAELDFLIVLKNGVQFQARLLSSENALLGLERL